MRWVEQKSDRRMRCAAIGMLCREPGKFFRDASQRIQLERMFSRTWLKELIESLLQIDRRGAGHVIEVVTLAIPGQRRSHGCAVARMEEVVGPGKVLLLRK